VTDQAILWRRLDQPGHESARLFFQHAHWHLTGTAVFAHHQQPCRLDYLVVCNAAWHTVSGSVTGWVGNHTVEIELSVDAARRWRLNGTECPAGEIKKPPLVSPCPPPSRGRGQTRPGSALIT
jgi:hypothetical protein